jgi:cyanophycin synthetase
MKQEFPTPADTAAGSLTPAEAVSRGVRPRRMTILEKGVYRGPHYYSHTPMVRLQVDLGDLEAYPSNLLPGFADRLLEALPGLSAHGCSYHAPGGFERRLRDGTWLGHIAEHVALELQTLAGHPTTRGKTRSVKGQPGVYNILFEYQAEDVALKAGEYALRLVDQLLPPQLAGLRGLKVLDRAASDGPFNLDEALQDLRGRVRKAALGPTTQALVTAARKRGIPVARLDEHSLIQLGQGSRQRRLRASITSQTSQIAVSAAGDKAMAKSLLAAAGLPVPRGAVVRSAEEAVAEARRLQFPLVTKPLDGNHGRGVSIGLNSVEELRWGFAQSAKHGKRVVVEEMLRGRDHRFLVVAGKVVAVAERVPAAVIGDGVHTVEQLVATVNEDPRRGVGHEAVMTRIVIDEHVRDQLARAGLTPQGVPQAGRRVELRATANLSTGGSAIDRTDVAHPDNIAIAEHAALVIGLDVAGIDFLAPDITRSVRETGGGIVEVNAAPGFRMHLEPSEGQSRDVAAPVIDSLFPRGTPARIPIFAITGTNGKSTTTRMVSLILRAQGLTVGCTSTTGIYLDDHLILAADASGPKSARMVLRHPKVDAAVLEVARGGILREGLGFDVCDVGAVLNITADHLGLRGVDTVEDLAAVKSVVVESVRRRGASVLNADDPLTLRMRRHAGGAIVLFSMHGDTPSPALRDHIDRGGLAAVFESSDAGGDLVLYRGGKRTPLMATRDIPATLGGAAGFNIQNALAAAAMTFAHGVKLSAIRAGLGDFRSTFAQNPGRLNIYEGHDFRVILDYAHNPASLSALADLIRSLRPDHRRVIGMVSIPGDRRNDDILTMGRIAASVFDELVFREAPDGRGRATGEVNALLTDGALAAGAGSDRVHRILDEMDAAEACLEMAGPGDLVVLLPTEVGKVWNQVVAFKPRVSGEAAARNA